ncbi:MAG: hypothetical protein JXB07_12680, partial [Anaerolineae bacterium]|nr:hypothetical protein [Anaerolineae bacterium]
LLNKDCHVTIGQTALFRGSQVRVSSPRTEDILRAAQQARVVRRRSAARIAAKIGYVPRLDLRPISVNSRRG